MKTLMCIAMLFAPPLVWAGPSLCQTPEALVLRSKARAHFDAVQPGYVYRVIHEELLENPEREIRGMLDFLGLPFEDNCLNFHQNTRAVRTASMAVLPPP